MRVVVVPADLGPPDDAANWRWIVAQSTFEWTPDGKANSWTFGSGPPKKLELPDIRRAAIIGTRVHYADPRMLLFGDFDVGQVNALNTRVADDGELHRRRHAARPALCRERPPAQPQRHDYRGREPPRHSRRARAPPVST